MPFAYYIFSYGIIIEITIEYEIIFLINCFEHVYSGLHCLVAVSIFLAASTQWDLDGGRSVEYLLCYMQESCVWLSVILSVWISMHVCLGLCISMFVCLSMLIIMHVCLSVFIIVHVNCQYECVHEYEYYFKFVPNF